MKKAGRKQQHYIASDGTQIKGLARRPSDGRWRIIGTDITFTEPDESKAIARYRTVVREGKYAGQGLEPDEIKWLSTPADQIVELNSVTALERGFALVGKPHEAWRRFWRYVASELDANPHKVAELAGRPQLAHWRNFAPPEPLPSLKAIRDNWDKHARCSSEQKSKVLRYWDRFVEQTEISSVDEITPKLAIDYQDFIYTEDYGGKMQSHLFGGIRTMINFARKRALAPSAMQKALDNLRLMVPSESAINRDPQPISRADFHRLLNAAKGDNRAMLLMMLNAALYIGEVVTVEWEEIRDGKHYVSRRKKKGEKIRVAVLWPETLEALKSVAKKGTHVFRSSHGNPLNKFTAFERFRAIVDKANEKQPKLDVKPSHLRDGAFTAAVAANVSLPIVNLLCGHISGMSDNYVQASPKIVEPATTAVYREYLG